MTVLASTDVQPNPGVGSVPVSRTVAVTPSRETVNVRWFVSPAAAWTATR